TSPGGTTFTLHSGRQPSRARADEHGSSPVSALWCARFRITYRSAWRTSRGDRSSCDMISIAEHRTAPSQERIQSARNADLQAFEPRREPSPIVGLHDQVNVIPLH